MEKLIVKNFGPIKEAEIDLTKYVVFIGDTSTGKSVLAKLITIFRDGIFKFSSNSSEKEENLIFENELRRYNIDYDRNKTEMYYYVNNELAFSFKKNKISFKLDNLKSDFSKYVEDMIENIASKSFSMNMLDFDKDDFTKFLLRDISQKTSSIYVPAERILYSMIGNSINGLWSNNISISNCYKEFAANYEVARRDFNKITFKDFDINYVYEDGFDKIKINDNKINLSQASSGIQSLLPLLIVLEKELKNEKFKYDKTILIEEPELNLFPVKQKRLIEHIISKISKLDDKLIITTHSPYILSVLDTLILAMNTINEKPKFKKRIEKIVSENKWIDYNDISVYEVKNDGTVNSIKNEEFKSIDANAIDSVSDIISNEFDKLTDLRYEQ